MEPAEGRYEPLIGYLDLLIGTYMVRQLQPWFENVAKRQVTAPKVYLRDPGLLHALLDIPSEAALHSHPNVGTSWEGFVIEQLFRTFARCARTTLGSGPPAAAARRICWSTCTGGASASR